MLSQAEFDRVNALWVEFDASRGRQVTIARSQLGATLRLQSRNYEEVRGFSRQLEDHDFALDLRRSPVATAEYTSEVVRLFHNYLGSVMTLVDHARHIIETLYKDDPFLSTYKSKVNTHFLGDHLHRFMQELRVEAVHHDLITADARTLIATDKFDTHLVLTLSRLQSIDWSASVRQYVTELHDDPRLDELLDDYHERVRAFYEWLDAEQASLHSTDLRQMEAILTEIAAIEGRNSYSPPPFANP